MDPFSAGYSAVACRRRVADGGRGYVSLAWDTEIRAFETLGYNIDQLHLEGVIEPAIRPIDVYRGLEHKAGVVDRVQEALLEPGGSLSSDDRNLLAHLGAVATGDARWCERIPARDTVVKEQMPFRDWCYLTLAYNTRDARICERMAPAASEAKVVEAKANGMRAEIAEQLSAQANCSRIGKWVGPPPHYGPEEPLDAAQIHQLAGCIGLRMAARTGLAALPDRRVLLALPRRIALGFTSRLAAHRRTRQTDRQDRSALSAAVDDSSAVLGYLSESWQDSAGPSLAANARRHAGTRELPAHSKA